MNIDERLESIAASLDTLTRIHIDNDREFRERFDRMSARIDKLAVNAEKDSENIRALVRIVEIHERRLTDLEGGPET